MIEDLFGFSPIKFFGLSAHCFQSDRFLDFRFSSDAAAPDGLSDPNLIPLSMNPRIIYAAMNPHSNSQL